MGVPCLFESLILKVSLSLGRILPDTLEQIRVGLRRHHYFKREGEERMCTHDIRLAFPMQHVPVRGGVGGSLLIER